MPGKTLRIAVASKYGTAIDEHFGHAKAFLIYDLNSCEPHFVERREVAHYCLGGHSDKSALAGILEAIKDCQAVMVAKIGDGPSEKLLARNIAPISTYAWEEINSALQHYSGYLSVT